jgi:copper(I)-binding protein
VVLPGAVAELHVILDGKMVRSGGIPVPARGSLHLRPGGPHIMIFNLPRDTAGGEELTLRLVFETSGERPLSVRIGKREKHDEQFTPTGSRQ